MSTTRRQFLQFGSAAGGGLLVGFALGGCDRISRDRNKTPSEAALGAATSSLTGKQPGLAPNAFIRIDRDGAVTLVMHKVEMGQGTFTAMPMLLAEELECDLDKVRLVQAPADNTLYGDPMLGGQVTGGSTSVRASWEPLRMAGAAARTVLLQAAADEWGVQPAELAVSRGVVSHRDGKTLHFGQLVEAAARLPVPKEVRLKDPRQFRLLGKPHARLDSAPKVDGSAQFGIDVRLPGMLVAAAAASPVFGGKLKAVNEPAAMAVPGVKKVLKLDNAVAVLAGDWWTASQGLAALAPEWDDGPHAEVSSASILKDMMAASEKGGAIARSDGDVVGGLGSQRGKRLDAIYQLPFLAHATMEPMNCTVDLRAGSCDLYVGTQVPALAQGAAAKASGLALEQVRVHNQYLGGGFGRRLEVDNVVQAVAFAKLAPGTPLKVLWSRPEDIQHDMYRPFYLDRLSARIDDKGKPMAWFHRTTGSSIMARFAPGAIKDGIDPDAVEGARDLQYRIPEVRVEYVRHEPPGIPTAFWRGVGATHNVFVVESFIDELAHAARQDPVAYRRALLEKAPRMLGVLNLAAEKSGWSGTIAPVDGRRVGKGVSVQFAFGSYMAMVAEVSVGKDGSVRVHRVVCAVDCGQVVNPDQVVAQVEGGVVFGASAALWGQITLDKGRVQQANFGDYRVMRMNEAPRVEVHIVASNDKPGGIGEPGTSAIAPAIANAVFAASGRRVRTLPLMQA
jgi:isoquinoline 1-oxidoreductase beta subunit